MTTLSLKDKKMETDHSVVEIVSESETILPAPPVKRKRGFAAMSPEKRAAISALGGKKAAQMGVSHRYSSEDAKENGRKGGLAPHTSRGRSKVQE